MSTRAKLTDSPAWKAARPAISVLIPFLRDDPTELLALLDEEAVSVSGAGVFTGSAAELRLKSNALGGALDDYELSFESGERMQGQFLVTRLDYAGDYNGERTYTISLESSGVVVSL